MTSNLMPTYPTPPVEFVSGKGARLTDASGKTYLDFLAGIAVVSLGHANKAVAATIKKQSKKLLHTSNFFGNEHNEKLAAELCELISPDGFNSGIDSNIINSNTSSNNTGQIFFCNSGAEANEAAIKLARKYGKNSSGSTKHKIICANKSFHGRTLGALSATGQPEKQTPFAPLVDGFEFVEFGNIEALESKITAETAAVLLEPILGEGGAITPPEHYLYEVRELCDKHNILMMLDEVQTGMARTGDWFAHHYGSGNSNEKSSESVSKKANKKVMPDVVTLAKALGNGFPIGACFSKTEIASTFQPGDHATTFGGQALAAATARTVIAEMKKIDAPSRAKELGASLSEKLSSIKGIKEVRGRGLMLAAELEVDGDNLEGDNLKEDVSPAQKVVSACLKNGLIINAVTKTAIRFVPPLIITEKDIDEAVEIFTACLTEIQK